MIHKDITILILLYKTSKSLLKNLIIFKNFHIMVLDQSNNADTKKYLKNILPNIQYYGLKKENRGFAVAQNFLIRKVKTKYFFSTQPDVKISVKSILALKKNIDKFKNCLVSVPKINGFKNCKVNKKSKKRQLAIDTMIGAAFMAEKKKFIKFGMFDEDFFFYWEDIEFSSRIKNNGYKIYINLDSVAFHKSGTSSKNDFQTLLIRNINFKYGEYLFFFKNKKLRLIKIIRQLLQSIIFIVFNFIIFRFRDSLINTCYLFGILKFLLFRLGINYKNEIQ